MKLKILAIFIPLLFFLYNVSFGDAVYLPTDSIPLTVGTMDSAILHVASADSIWFFWGRFDGDVFTIVDSAKVTTAIRTGVFAKKIKASCWDDDSLGSMIAFAKAFKGTVSGVKTWSWISAWSLDSTDIAQISREQSADALHDSGYTALRASRLDSVDAKTTSRLRSTVSGRTLDVTLTGEAGIDWANVGSPTTAVNLSGTRIGTAYKDSTLIEAVKAKTDQFIFTTNGVNANVNAIDSNFTPAYNLKLILDNDSTTAARADFKQVTMKPDGTNSHGLWVKGNGYGYGILADGGANGTGFGATGLVGAEFGSGSYSGTIGLWIHGGGIGVTGTGLYVEGGQNGVHIKGINSRGIEVFGNEEGIYLQGTDDPGLSIESDAASGLLIYGYGNDATARVRMGGRNDSAIVLGLGSGKVHGTLDAGSGFWHSVALASDSGGFISGLADTMRGVLHDSLAPLIVFKDSVEKAIEDGNKANFMADVSPLLDIMGAVDGDTSVFYPVGSTNKDSCAIFHNGWKKSFSFGHSNVETVIDSVFTH
jgi:hypothetical protein